MSKDFLKSSVTWVAAAIDWGNGFIKGAYVGTDSKAADVRNDQTGVDSTPSAFLFLKGEILWGELAKNARALCPSGYVAGEDVKRNLGNPSWRFKAPDGKEWTALELYSLGATRMAALLATLAKGKRVVVQPTFPENFAEIARRAVIEAYKLAGVDCLDPVSEPVAAAYYLASAGEFQAAMIVDVGHGTTDVSVVRFDGKTLRVVAHSGIPELGGRDFRNLIEAAFLKEASFTPDAGNPDHLQFVQELRASAERAKITLSSVSEATVVATPPGAKPHSLTLTRAHFESLAAPLAGRIVELARKVVNEAKCQPRDLTWLLVGGGSRIPLIATSLHTDLGVVAKVHPEASNAIARGAALLAAERLREEGRTPVDLEGRPAVGPGLSLITAAPHTLGVLSHTNGPSSPLQLAAIILRNTPIEPNGTSATKTFLPLHDMQPRVCFKIAQGEPGALEHQCRVIGELVLALEPPVDRMSTMLKVTFIYDRGGLVHVEAIDMRNGQTVKCELRAPGTPAAAA